MRQDLMYVHPEDFNRAYKWFKYAFSIWVVGYEKWGAERYQAVFVKDPTVPRGLIMGCSHGDRLSSISILIGEVPKPPAPIKVRS